MTMVSAQSLKSKPAVPMGGGPKKVWGDQRKFGRTKELVDQKTYELKEAVKNYFFHMSFSALFGLLYGLFVHFFTLSDTKTHLLAPLGNYFSKIR